jgi:hypothetical protein
VSAVTELIRERVGIIVTRGLDSYGRFGVDSEKRAFYRVVVDLLLAITDRIDSNEVVTISPLRDLMTSGLFVVGFDSQLVIGIFESVSRSLYREVEESGIVDPDTMRIYQKYEGLLLEVVGDFRALLQKSVSDYLGEINEYGSAETVVSLPPTRSRLLTRNRTTHDPLTVPRSRLRNNFRSVFDTKINQYSDIVSNASRDINAITSDSQTPDPLDPVDRDRLVATFAGEGKKIYEDIERLFNFSIEMSGYQGSLVGAVEYQATYYEYLMAMSYGKVLPQGVLTGDFGDFEEIYDARATDTSIPGLKFLEPLYTTRSANQTVGLSVPVAAKYTENGIANRYVPPSRSTSTLDHVSLALESVYTLCLKVGDTVRSLLNASPGGIGDTATQLSVLARVFPQSVDLELRGTGVTGAIGSLLAAHRTLYSLLGYEPDLKDFNDRLTTLAGQLSTLIQTLRTAGFRPGGHVPSLALTYYEPDKDKVKNRLVSLGFSRVEADDIVNVQSFTELLNRFAPVTDSQDVISFFRAYDLTKLIYEFGGQEAIDTFTDFLYGRDPDRSVLRLLEFLNRGRSLASKVKGSEYSKLIGYLVTVTYAVDPGQLAVLDSVLKRNNLDLFESITYLVEQGIPTVIRDRSDVSLLSGMVAQMVTLDNDGYESQKPLWNELISQSAGNIGKSVSGLYTRTSGITPTELYAALNRPSATSPLGQILGGVRGGRLTSLLRYCNIFGLLYSLSPYRNSGQLVNQSADDYVVILELLDTMEMLTERLELARLILDDNATGDSTAEATYTDPIVQVQNKELAAVTDLVTSIGTEDVPNPDQYRILESPGIGNSRVSNGVRITNSLTPEEAAIISVSGSRIGAFTQAANSVETGSYIRIAVSNLLANGVLVDGLGANNIASDTNTLASNTDSPVSDYTVEYVPASGDGTSQPSSFDPLSSCIRFGNTNCTDQGYPTTSELCSTGYNKSLYPETGYGELPGFVGGVQVDRTLGDGMTGNVTYQTTPAAHPQRPFTISGLTESSRSSVLKDNPMACATLKDPYEYGACMSMLKCKRFRPPYEGRYSFPFCPSTLHGGRLRK